MLIRSQSGRAIEPLAHGGDLAAARAMFPGAPEPFIDLSTGINPHRYPLPDLPGDSFARLPDRTAIRRLASVAASAYGAPSPDHVVPAPGTQMLLPQVAALAEPGRAAILETTYAEHRRAAELAGHQATIVADMTQLRDADLAVVVNPNNPDGRIVTRQELLDLADHLRRGRGMLVVDESFADVVPGASLAGETNRDNIVVLRSFGKFYGLAGLRLGFAIASPRLAERLDAMLGPWAVSGPAVVIGEKALADVEWKRQTVGQLAADAKRLDELLVKAGLDLAGGTPLYRLTRSHDAYETFDRLGRAGILVRRFAEAPTWLRWGLPAGESEWSRLSAALDPRSRRFAAR
jgi:cobalamin biosynthetic protein CobC